MTHILQLKKHLEKLGIDVELINIWQYEYAHVTDESRNIIDSIDDVIKKSIEDVDLEEFLREENNDS